MTRKTLQATSRVAVLFIAFICSMAASRAQTCPLSTTVFAPQWLQYRVDFIYVGDHSSFYSANIMGGAGININQVAVRPFIIRVYGYNTGRTDQSRALIFNNVPHAGVVAVYPGHDYLAPYIYTGLRFTGQ